MSKLKNAGVSLVATLAIIAIVLAVIAAIVGFVKLCVAFGPAVFATCAFCAFWAGIHYELKKDGAFE